MKTIVRPHPLKEIILEFDDSKAQPDFEQEALARYYEAHDEVWDLKQRITYLSDGLKDVQRKVDEYRMEALVMEQSLDLVEDALGLSDGNELPEIPDEITIDVTGLFQDFGAHSMRIDALYEQVSQLTQKYNEEVDRLDPEDIYQEDWPVHSRYFGVFDQVYDRYEESSVNIVSVDDDEQVFLGIYSELYEAYDAILASALEVFEVYKVLIDQVNILYDRVSVAYAAVGRQMDQDLGEDFGEDFDIK